MIKFISSFSPKNLTEVENVDLSSFSGVDMVEWRADALPAEEIIFAAPLVFEKFKAMPVLFTIRTAEEGGGFEQSEQFYGSILKHVLAEFEPVFVDVEAWTKPAVLERLGTFMPKLWLSYHDFREIPENISSIISDLAEHHPAAVKVALKAKTHAEVWQLLREAAIFRENHETPLIAIAMGEIGRISRLLAEDERASWTFVATQQSSAPGQFSLSDSKRIFEIMSGGKNETY